MHAAMFAKQWDAKRSKEPKTENGKARTFLSVGSERLDVERLALVEGLKTERDRRCRESF